MLGGNMGCTMPLIIPTGSLSWQGKACAWYKPLIKVHSWRCAHQLGIVPLPLSVVTCPQCTGINAQCKNRSGSFKVRPCQDPSAFSHPCNHTMETTGQETLTHFKWRWCLAVFLLLLPLWCICIELPLQAILACSHPSARCVCWWKYVFLLWLLVSYLFCCSPDLEESLLHVVASQYSF